ncbi:alpha-hydroxy-acid oxidizing protein, partial [Acinetobacter baumannii]
WSLEQRVLRTVPKRDLATTYLGRRQALPFILGPVGFLGLYADDGEIKAARAAAAADIPICLSTFSINSITDLRAASQGELH